MFTIEDTSRSLSVALPNRGFAITSGGIWHRTGFSFDDARSHADRLNRIAAELPGVDAESLFAIYNQAHFAACDGAQDDLCDDDQSNRPLWAKYSRT